MNNGGHSPKNFGGYRSKRRRRRAIIRNIVLIALIVVIFAGMFAFLISLKKNSEIEKNTETESITETETIPPETELPGVLEKDYTIKTYTSDDLHRGDLILVREGAPFVFPEKQPLADLYSGRKLYGDKSRAYQISSTDLFLAPDVLDMLNKMTEAFYEETGKNALLVKSAYRSEEEQQEIFDYRVERDGEEEALKYVARPGESEHHTAMAFDMSVYKDGVNTYIQDEEDYLPIYEEAHKYGFILRYPEEKAAVTGISYEAWHFRYVGVPHAYYMYTNGLCLEEYLELLKKNYSYDSVHLTFDCDDGHTYEIYSVPAKADGSADIILPSGYEFDVSGNNTDGFVVTVTVK